MSERTPEPFDMVRTRVSKLRLSRGGELFWSGQAYCWQSRSQSSDCERGRAGGGLGAVCLTVSNSSQAKPWPNPYCTPVGHIIKLILVLVLVLIVTLGKSETYKETRTRTRTRTRTSISNSINQSLHTSVPGMTGHLNLPSSDLCTVWYRTRWYLCDL